MATTTVPPAVLVRLRGAYEAVQRAQQHYEAMAQIAVEAMGYDLATVLVSLDIATGTLTVQPRPSDAELAALVASPNMAAGQPVPPGYFGNGVPAEP
jgi:hypothetical protein